MENGWRIERPLYRSDLEFARTVVPFSLTVSICNPC